MKILVVDDHALVREGLRHVLTGLDEQVEVLQAAQCAHAFELAALHADIDLVLLDYHLPDMSGLEALDVFGSRHPELPVVVLSGAPSPLMMRQVVTRGAAGFLSKSSISDELLSALRRVLAGEVLGAPEIATTDGQADASNAETTGSNPELSRRQEEVLYLLLDGYSSRAISEKLFLSEETTKSHVSAIIHAFGVKSRLQAVLAAGRYGYGKTAPPS